MKKYYMNNYMNSPVERSLIILSKYFEEIMEEQDIFGVDESRNFRYQSCIEIMLRIITQRSEKLKERVADRWYKIRGSPARDMLRELEAELIKF